MIYVAVFLLAFFGDIGWTMYFIEVEKDHAIRASAWSAFIVAMGGIATFEYVKSPLIIIPAVLGSFAGVWFTMRWPKIKAWVINQRPDPADRIGSGKTGL